MTTAAQFATKCERFAVGIKELDTAAMRMVVAQGRKIVDGTLAASGGFKVNGSPRRFLGVDGDVRRSGDGPLGILQPAKAARGLWQMAEYGTDGIDVGWRRNRRGGKRRSPKRAVFGPGLTKGHPLKGHVKGREPKHIWVKAYPAIRKMHAETYALNVRKSIGALF